MPNSKPPNNTKPCPITRKELAELYWGPGETKAVLAERFQVSWPTILKWFNQYELDSSKKRIIVEQLEDAYMTNEGRVIWAKDNPALFESDDKTEQTNDVAIIQPSGQSPNVQSDSEHFDNESPWAHLSINQRKGVVLLASIEADDLIRTQLDQAELLNIAPETLINWKRDKNFSICLRQMRMEQFKNEGTLMFTADLLHRLRTKQNFTQEDRRLLGDLLGLTKDGNTVNVAVQVNTGDGKLKGIF